MLLKRVVLLLLVFLAGCEFTRESRPSVLIVAVEGLGFEELSCEADELMTGLDTFCEEFVRFTHAYTPSTMSQAAMSSLMTGLYPLDHGVRNNGDHFLSARFQTLAEGALEIGYHTLFVSGGPPLWRKSGLAQGFEVFDDAMELGPGQYYRPSAEVVKVAMQWSEQQSDRRPTFTVLFLADLQFPETSTRRDDGELREQSTQAQREEIFESLATYVGWLKRRKMWDPSYVVLVGLNGASSGQDKEPQMLSLRSMATQVSLFIKPAKKPRDAETLWTIDRNVSLVDVSATLYQALGLRLPSTSVAQLQPQSLVESLVQPEPTWREGRMVLSESAWPDWLEGAGVRSAIRQNQFFYIHDQKPLVFNTLTDRMENWPLKVTDPLWVSLNTEVRQLIVDAKIQAFRGLTPHWPDVLMAAQKVWLGDGRNLVVRGHEPWARWYLRKALSERNWSEVKRLSQEIGDPVGRYVAAVQLGESSPVPRNPCVRLVLPAYKAQRKELQSECGDERTLALSSWLAGKDDEERAMALDRFVRLQAQVWMDREIGRLNYLNGLRWDVDRDWPELPQSIEYLLTLKEFEPFAKRASALLGAKDVPF